MNDTALETTAAMATLVEQEVLGKSLLSVEEEENTDYTNHIVPLLLFLPIYRKHNST